jgi:carboxyl-terminal processing protease
VNAERRRGFVAGLLVGAAVAMAGAAAIVEITGSGDQGNVASQALDVIRSDYFKPVDAAALENASVEGMVSTLKHRYGDRFTHYFDPRSLTQFDQSTSGEFSGVGLTVSEVRQGLRVASVLPDTPAERAGIQRGDVITAVNGRSIAGVPSEVSTARIKGEPGTAVTLRVVSATTGRARSVRLRRATVRVPAVDGRIRDDGGQKVAYVRFATFSAGAHGDLRATLERLYRRGAEGLVLDMRGNGGGLLNEAVLCASLFLDRGQTVVTTESRSMGHHEYDAVGDPLATHPVVVLVNHDTASAAEILTAALADHGLATVVGTRTYGKGTFQEVIHLAAGGALDLTVGEFFAADGESLLGKGIDPDVHVADDPRTPGDEALQRALAVLRPELPGR